MGDYIIEGVYDVSEGYCWSLKLWIKQWRCDRGFASMTSLAQPNTSGLKYKLHLWQTVVDKGYQYFNKPLSHSVTNAASKLHILAWVSTSSLIVTCLLS